uniref:DUF7041 domain-containing protein n=1 Tax=Macrostomum lignano TaxID=282301 RepID=A0A1I8GGB4_9PLAT
MEPSMAAARFALWHEFGTSYWLDSKPGKQVRPVVEVVHAKLQHLLVGQAGVRGADGQAKTNPMTDSASNNSAPTPPTNAAPVVTTAVGNAADTASVSLAHLKLPIFYRNNPEAWFLTLEAQFMLNRVTNETAKFYHLVSHLPEDIAALHLSAQTPKQYEQLKTAITSTLQKSKQEKVSEVLQVSDLGGDKPSIFMRKLRSKMEQCQIQPDEELLKATLMRCLPQDLRIALSGFQQQSSQQISEIADSMLVRQFAQFSRPVQIGHPNSALSKLHTDKHLVSPLEQTHLSLANAPSFAAHTSTMAAVLGRVAPGASFPRTARVRSECCIPMKKRHLSRVHHHLLDSRKTKSHCDRGRGAQCRDTIDHLIAEAQRPESFSAAPNIRSYSLDKDVVVWCETSTPYPRPIIPPSLRDAGYGELPMVPRILTSEPLAPTDIRTRLQELLTELPSPHAKTHEPRSYVPKDLEMAEFVWVRVDRVRSPLEAPYSGPYRVKQRTDKFFVIFLPSGNTESVSIDRLKPARLSLPKSAVQPAANSLPEKAAKPRNRWTHHLLERPLAAAESNSDAIMITFIINLAEDHGEGGSDVEGVLAAQARQERGAEAHQDGGGDHQGLAAADLQKVRATHHRHSVATTMTGRRRPNLDTSRSLCMPISGPEMKVSTAPPATMPPNTEPLLPEPTIACTWAGTTGVVRSSSVQHFLTYYGEHQEHEVQAEEGQVEQQNAHFGQRRAGASTAAAATIANNEISVAIRLGRAD